MAAELAAGSEFPSKIGRHTVLGYLASGGMAEIFLGRGTTDGVVVIKRILPHLARHGNFVSMFIDEARIGSLVHHPNVVEIFELGQIGFDLFMVMEYLEGENIAGLVRRLVGTGQQLPFAQGAYVVAEACAGLHAAHSLCDERGKSLGLVHRDISPQNIFVTYDGQVKVLDFGIATAAHRLTRTATGQLKGKFAYMSPEQCRGEPLDLRSDLFSLGVVLYELTTQRRLFKQEHDLMLLKAITETPIRRPSREIADYPESLERICMKALARDKADRYRSALELRDDLLHVISALSSVEDHRQALASAMTGLFGERIQDKREMLDKVRIGTELGKLPPAEVDELVDVPQVNMPSVDAHTVPAETIVPSSSAPRAGGRRWMVGLSALVLGGGLATWWILQARSSQPSHSAPSVVVAPPDARTRVVVRIDSHPSGARLMVDGEPKGTTPTELLFDERKPDVTLHLELDAHVTVDQHISIDHDQQLVFTLADAPTRVPTLIPSPPAKRGKPKPQENGSADPFQRFD